MKVLFAGTAGLAKVSILDRLAKVVEDFSGKKVYRDPKTNQVPVLDRLIYGEDPIPFLRLPEAEQRAQWERAFRLIQEQFRSARTEHHFLGAHLIYRYEQIPSCIVNFQAMAEWGPDWIITFVDDVYCVRQRIHEGGYRPFTLYELILWRAEELLVSDLISRFINPEGDSRSHVISVKQSPTMLARLLQPKTVPVYLSYSITSARKSSEHRIANETFRRRILSLDNLAAYDPLTIDELPPVSLARGLEDDGTFSYQPGNSEHRWPLLDPDDVLLRDDDLRDLYPLPIPVSELKSVLNPLKAQVRHRDVRLVDQGRYLIVYRPTISGEATLSTGVHSEIEHAFHTKIPMILYIKKDEDPFPDSPFIPNAEADPNFFYEETEEGFWNALSGLDIP